MFLPDKVRLFPLIYWFVELAHRQTWYQKFIGICPPLTGGILENTSQGTTHQNSGFSA